MEYLRINIERMGCFLYENMDLKSKSIESGKVLTYGRSQKDVNQSK